MEEYTFYSNIMGLTVVRISFKHGWWLGLSSYMEVGTDVRPEWPPFSNPEIYLWVYFFILKYYMNPPNVQTPRCMNDKGRVAT